MRNVDFFIVGQPKSGTTALADFLSQHPEICMANPKEPGYFAQDHLEESDALYGEGTYLKARTLEEYEHHFSHCHGERLKGEATTTYLYSKVAAQKIHDYNPQAKIIIMLRNPVQFLHSLHMQYVNDSSEDERDFSKALAKEPARKRGRDLPKGAMAIVPSLLFYSERIKYAEQIERYQKLFPAKHILILTAEDFRADNLGTYQRVARFLGVDDGFVPKMKQVNASAAPRSYALHRALNSRLIKKQLYQRLGPQQYSKLKGLGIKLVMKEQGRTAFDEGVRQRLLRTTAPEVAKASKLTRLDLAGKWGYKTAPAHQRVKN